MKKAAKQDFTIEPYVGALPVTFRMKENEVAAVIGPPDESRVDWRGCVVESRKHINIGYSKEDGTVDEIVFAPGASLMFAGNELLKEADVAGFLMKHDHEPVATLGFLIFLKLGIGVTGFHDRQYSQRAIRVYGRGRMDDELLEDAIPWKPPAPRPQAKPGKRITHIAADEFVKRLAAASPAKLPHKKGSKQYVNENKGFYLCKKRRSALKLATVKNAENIIELFSRWDPSTLAAGETLEFLAQPENTARGLKIGTFISDPVVIAPDGKVIVIEEGSNKRKPLYELAATGNKLLDAFLIAAEFLGQSVADGIPTDELPDESRAAAAKCAIAAGGREYVKGYREIFGVND